jgi:hypothetical protein
MEREIIPMSTAPVSIGHALSSAAALDIELDIRVDLRELFSPDSHHRIEAESTGTKRWCRSMYHPRLRPAVRPQAQAVRDQRSSESMANNYEAPFLNVVPSTRRWVLSLYRSSGCDVNS